MNTLVGIDEAALLAAIRANPVDDLPRLVYCDWLEERGNTILAQFIRHQIAKSDHAIIAATGCDFSTKNPTHVSLNNVSWSRKWYTTIPKQLKRKGNADALRIILPDVEQIGGCTIDVRRGFPSTLNIVDRFAVWKRFLPIIDHPYAMYTEIGFTNVMVSQCATSVGKWGYTMYPHQNRPPTINNLPVDVYRNLEGYLPHLQNGRYYDSPKCARSALTAAIIRTIRVKE